MRKNEPTAQPPTTQRVKAKLQGQPDAHLNTSLAKPDEVWNKSMTQAVYPADMRALENIAAALEQTMYVLTRIIDGTSAA